MEQLEQDKIFDNTINQQETQVEAHEATALELIAEVESETMEERKTRRTTLYQKLTQELNLNELKNISIMEMEMNVSLNIRLNINSQDLRSYHFNHQLFQEVMRQANFRMKNYTRVYMRKA